MAQSSTVVKSDTHAVDGLTGRKVRVCAGGGAAPGPCLLVNVGSGVSMLELGAAGSNARVSGTNLGGGTFWRLARLLLGQEHTKTYTELLDLAARGDGASVDMAVGDIYGKDVCATAGLPEDLLACSFGKVLSGDLDLAACDPAGACAFAVVHMCAWLPCRSLVVR
jgi:pantothenate kinase